MDRYLLANRYELIDKIGSGGMATVYRARCQTLDRIVAVKILKDELAADPSLVNRFKSEALAAARLSHPNLVNIFDVGEDNGIHFIVMEYIEGHTLKDIISQQGTLSSSQAINIAAMVCDGLEHAHSRGLIHRDIKPHNILVTNDGNVKIADFGIARVVNTSTITYGSNVMGSVYYISPEQAKGEAVGPETDIYSLGCVLYEMVTGKPIFDGDSPITLALKHVHEDPISPRVLNPSVSGNLERVIMRAVAKEPGIRYHSANDMKEALTRNNDISPVPPRNKKQPNEKTKNMAAKNEDKGKLLSKTNIIWIAVALLGLALGMLTTNRDMIFGKEVKVPDIVGLTQKEAFDQLKEKDLQLRVIKQITSDKYDAGRIISQDPQAGDSVKTGREIEVTVSKGSETVAVPGLIGKDLGVATSMLQEAGLDLNVERTYDEEAAANTVLEQEPAAGKQVKPGSKINLVVSKGPKPAGSNVPNVVGMYLSEAKGTLEAAGLVLGDINKEDSDKFFTGQVINQNPKAGTEAEQGTPIVLTVSKGPGPGQEHTTINYTLPPDQDYYQVRMILRDAKGEREIYSGLNRANETIQVVVNYYGQGEVIVYLNSEQRKKYEI